MARDEVQLTPNEVIAVEELESVSNNTDIIKDNSGAISGLLHNRTATTDPTTGDDSGDGYAVGSRWINVTDDKEFVCLDATLTAAVWERTTKPIESFVIACSDLSTALTTGTSKAYFRCPYAFYVTEVRASVLTAPTGANLVVDINESGTSILGDKLSIDATETTSTTATTPATITDASIADDAIVSIDIDTVGSTVAGAGLIVTLIGYKV